MKRKFLSYIILLLGILVVSCQADLNGISNSLTESDGHSISVSIDIPDVRTRAIDMNPGAGVYLKNIWIGVYDKTTGNRVGGTGTNSDGTITYTDTEEIKFGDYLAAAGATIIDLVKIGFGNSTLSSTNDYCVVGVANYDKIKTTDGKDLYDALKAADTWNDFKNIAIDTRNSEFELQTPVLAGYMEKEISDLAKNGYIKVDQFATGNAVNLSGYDSDKAADVYLKGKDDQGINTKYTTNDGIKNYVLKLRRMRSKINVLINKDVDGNPAKDDKGNPIEGITITNLEYKVFNKPASSFLVQRQTNTSPESDKAEYSPNSADVNETGYFNDEDWTAPPLIDEFSFEHFENKHWAKNAEGLGDYHDREKNDGNGLFKVLANDADDWNNNASYFVLKMNIRDEKNRKNGEVYYTIHEGFINDENDVKSNDLTTRLMDFSCVRNTEYFYEITVSAIDKIDLKVYTSHPNDQKGTLWKMNYVSNVENGNHVESGNGADISATVNIKEDDDEKFQNSDIALRLVGSYYDPGKRMEIPVDLCYNFQHGELDGFAGLWPEPTNAYTEYIAKTKSTYETWKEFYNGNSDNANNLRNFIDKVKVKRTGETEYVNIEKYLEAIQDENADPNIEGYHVEGYKYYIAYDPAIDNERDHLRGLYIFDREKARTGGTRVVTDKDAQSHNDDISCFLYQINAMEQFPYYLVKETDEMIYAAGTAKHFNYDANGMYADFSDGHDGEGMLLSEEPDFAFRLLGYDGDTQDYYDIWYNLALSEYTEFANGASWPQYNLNNTKSLIVQKGFLGEGVIPKSFLDGIKVVVNNKDVYDINTFIWQYENGVLKLSSTDKLGFVVGNYAKNAYSRTEEKQRASMRAFYLLDKKNKNLKPAIYEEDSHTATYQVYAVEQYPGYKDPTPLTLPSSMPSIGTKSAENFLDQYIAQNVSLPVIPGIDPADYRYQIEIGTATWIVDVEPVGDKFTFDIPMKASSGSGSMPIYVRAVAINEIYANSSASQIGTAALTDPKYNFADATWTNRYKAWPTQSTSNGGYGELNHESRSYGNITFYSPDNTTANRRIRGYFNKYVSFENSGCSINFKVYKNCKITVKGTGTLSITGADPASVSLNSNGVTSTVDIEDYDYKEVTLSGSGAQITDIIFLPAD